MPVSFQFRLLPFIATVAVVVLGLNLGLWQSRRAAEKEAIAATMAERMHSAATQWRSDTPQEQLQPYSKVMLRGQFLDTWPVYLDNRPMQGRAGMYVLMPFKLEGSRRHVLVARGWQARNPQDRTVLPRLLTPSGTIEIQGIVKEHLERVMQLGQPEPYKPGAILQNLEIASLEKETGLAFYPLIVEQTSPSEDHLRRDWPAASLGIDKHKGYAFQWYALSLMAGIFFVVTGIRRGKNAESKNAESKN